MDFKITGQKHRKGGWPGRGGGGGGVGWVVVAGLRGGGVEGRGGEDRVNRNPLNKPRIT